MVRPGPYADRSNRTENEKEDMRMDAKKRYQEWLENPYFDQEAKEELKSIAQDEKEIQDRFYRDLEFGTGGLRGVI